MITVSRMLYKLNHISNESKPYLKDTIILTLKLLKNSLLTNY
jgi:hypothetical protein